MKCEIYFKGDYRVFYRNVRKEGYFLLKEKVMVGRFRGVLDIGVFRKV